MHAGRAWSGPPRSYERSAATAAGRWPRRRSFASTRAPLGSVPSTMNGNSGDIWIRLTRSQIARVRTAEDDVGDLVAQVAAGLDADPTDDVEHHIAQLVASPPSQPKISTSMLRGLYLLAALPKDGSAVKIVEFARETGISQSTAHRYLNTLVAVGLVDRDAKTRGYRRAQSGRRN